MRPFHHARKLTAGVLDSGPAALTTLIAGVYALSHLDVAEVAAYSFFMTGGLLAMLLPRQTGYMPYRLEVTAQGERFRPSMRYSLRQALVPSLAGAAIAAVSALPAASSIPFAVYGYAAAAAAAWVVLSPLQDHVRSALHATSRHGGAAAVSVVNLVVCAASFGLLALTLPELEELWLPFAVLSLGNVASLLMGAVLLRGSHVWVPTDTRTMSGGRRVKFLPAEVLLQGSAYLTSLIVITTFGTSGVATLEAARLVAQPVFVISSAVITVQSPKIVRLFSRNQLSALRRQLLLTGVSTLGLGLLYIVAVIAAQSPITHVVGPLFVLPLALARSASFAVQALTTPYSSLYYRSDRFARLTIITAVAVGVGLASQVLSSPFLALYSVPAGLAVAAILRQIVAQIDLRSGRIAPRPTDDSNQ